MRARLATLVKKNARRKAAVLADMARIEAAPRLVYETELLKAAKTKPFDAFAEVIDYGVDPPARLKIALEPGVPLQQQVEKRFKLARRLQAAEGKALERLQQIESEERALAAVVTDAQLVAFFSDEKGEAPRRKGETPKPELPYREYVSASGRAIWVGKSGKKNDLMTFKHASPHAQWLHASGYAGTHVVVPKKKGEGLDPATLEDASRLAAHFSKAPEGVAVEVSVTEVKFVRKFRGANTGQVRIERETHRLVDNDPALVKVILARRA